MRQHSQLLLLLVFVAIPAGCGRRCVPQNFVKSHHLIDASAPLDAHVPVSPDTLREVAFEFRRRATADHPPGTRPYTMLALSGGGVYGAFGAGVLNGWTASGGRPDFDVVTGISTGALISTFAFLGPEYDDLLRVFALEQASQRDIMRRIPLALISHYNAVFSSAPLERQIRQKITHEILCKVAQAHATGRRLYIGTTNLDTRRLTIWDMGAIASRGTPEALDLFHSIVLASSSVPGMFPPVHIPVTVDGKPFEELHVDGGVSDDVIFRAFMVGDLNRIAGKPGALAPPGSTLFVVNNSKLYSEPRCVHTSFVSILSATASSIMYGKLRDELCRIFLNCLMTGTEFRLASIPQDMPVGPRAFRMNRDDREKLFAAGYQVGLMPGHNPHWRDLPPGTEPSEQALPRSGTDFLSTSTWNSEER